jgi:hypothetical protein
MPICIKYLSEEVVFLHANASLAVFILGEETNFTQPATLMNVKQFSKGSLDFGAD